MKEITATRQGSYIKVTIEEDKKADVCFFCKDIRGALVWATSHSPNYYCVFAQKDEVNPQGKSPLLLLSEGEAELPRDLFQKLVKDARRYACGQFYVGFDRKNWEFVNLFRDFCQYQRIPNIELTKAPLIENFNLGVALIKEWAKALEVPESSILRNQLKDMEMSDVDDKPEERFYAVNALRFIVASLPWQAPGAFEVRRSPPADSGGWT